MIQIANQQMLMRIGSAGIGLPILAVMIFAGAPLFSIFVAILAGIAAWELTKMAQKLPQYIPWYYYRYLSVMTVGWSVSMVGIAHFFVSGTSTTYLSVYSFLIIIVSCLVCFTLLKRTDLDIFVLGTAFGISVYTGGLLSFAVLLRGLDSGLEWVIVTSITVFATDTAALYFGKIFGRTPLAPEISPSKTLEGAVGGIFCSVLIITVSLDIVGLEVDIAARLILGVTIGLCAQLGDLFESWMKRTTGVKDSGSLIPGHGGVLDRLDSIIPNLAIVYSFVTWGT